MIVEDAEMQEPLSEPKGASQTGHETLDQPI